MHRADEAVANGDTAKPLLGVPVTIKEHIWVTGSPSTWNAKIFGFTAPRNAAVVEQIKNAGAIILGTTNVPFMLSDYQTQGEVYPTASNPYDTSRTPGEAPVAERQHWLRDSHHSNWEVIWAAVSVFLLLFADCTD